MKSNVSKLQEYVQKQTHVVNINDMIEYKTKIKKKRGK